MANNEEPDPEEMGTWVNQRQDEPLPASHDDDRGQSAVVRNEQHAETHATGGPGGPRRAVVARYSARPAVRARPQ